MIFNTTVFFENAGALGSTTCVGPLPCVLRAAISANRLSSSTDILLNSSGSLRSLSMASCARLRFSSTSRLSVSVAKGTLFTASRAVPSALYSYRKSIWHDQDEPLEGWRGVASVHCIGHLKREHHSQYGGFLKIKEKACEPRASPTITGNVDLRRAGMRLGGVDYLYKLTLDTASTRELFPAEHT